MKPTDLAPEITRLLGAEHVFANEPMSRHTTFRVGGPADIFCEPGTIEELKQVVVLCKENDVPFYVLGRGSNVLIADAGLRAVVIHIAGRLSEVRLQEQPNDSGQRIIVAQAGASNAQVGEVAAAAALAGFEFASGIPGSIGGSALMNAGAYGGEFCNVCTRVTCMDEAGALVTVPREEAAWSYRHSMMESAGLIVLDATFELTPGSEADIRATMADLAQRRLQKQPLELPSAGSTFKRPEGYYAGKLIQDAGLRGFTIGGAQVSEKHAGFVVNTGNATAEDIRAVIAAVRARVLDQSGVEMHPEVRMWGFGKDPLAE